MNARRSVTCRVGVGLIAAAACLADDPAGGSVNVRDYGARGDGVTDDTAAIRTAAEAARTTRSEPSAIPTWTPLPGLPTRPSICIIRTVNAPYQSNRKSCTGGTRRA